MIDETETYLGDGLYVSFDGYRIRLRAPREAGDHEVFLEPAVIASFIAWWTAKTRKQQESPST